MSFFKRMPRVDKHRIHIEKPQIAGVRDEQLWKEVSKYAKLVPFEPEPNMGRVQEIKEEIKKGTYLTREKIEGSVARIASRFLKKDY